MVQRQQQSYSSRAWKQLRMLAHYQRYVAAYLKYLQQGKQGSGDPTVDQLDSQLDEAVILLFRRMAHAKLKEIRAKASAAEAAKQPAQQQTWVGWLLGTGAKPAQQQAQPVDAAAAGAGEELDTSMGVAEWNKLEDVLAQQAVGALLHSCLRWLCLLWQLDAHAVALSLVSLTKEWKQHWPAPSMEPLGLLDDTAFERTCGVRMCA